MSEPYLVRPIGFVRSPYLEKIEAPRQAIVAEGVLGHIEVLPEHEHALDDLDGFERVWVIFWFHRVPQDRRAPSKVLPPRSEHKRGVFATRSPHRPNPIGLSAVRLERVDGLTVHIRDLDLIDGTPVLDLKPYVSYADAFPEARGGWLERNQDPRAPWTVTFTAVADAQLAWLVSANDGSVARDLRSRITEALALGPQPHPYRRIKKSDDGALVLAVKEWRVRFQVVERAMTVLAIASGYRARELATGNDPKLPLHRAFVARFRYA